MKRSSFNRGMSKLISKGISKSSAFNRMSALASVNKINNRAGNTKKSRYIASKNLSKIARKKSHY